MKAKLYTYGGYLGKVTLQDTRMFPKILYLDEKPRGGMRLFIHRSSTDCYDEISSNDTVTVKLDLIETNEG